MNKKHINLLLSANYVPTWSAKNICVEIFANSIDADPNYKIEFPTPHRMVATTKTNPSLSNMLVMGSGTKTGDDSKIGNFCEGGKLANLVATRLGYNMKIKSPMGEVTFSFKKPKGFDEKTLHATINPNLLFDGYEVSFDCEGIEEIFKENILIDHPIGPVEKKCDKLRIYSNGILITKLPETSIYDWNLDKIELNRDRSIPSLYEVKSKIAHQILDHQCKDKEFIKSLLKKQSSYEVNSLQYSYVDEETQFRFKEAWDEMKDTIIASSDQHKNTIAEYKGYSVETVSSNLNDALAQCNSVDKVLTVSDEFDFIDFPQEKLKIVHDLLDILEVSCIIKVFTAKEGTLGFYDGSIIGLSEELFMPGNKSKLLGAVIHECSHFLGGDDATIEFEKNMMDLSAKLAIKLL